MRIMHTASLLTPTASDYNVENGGSAYKYSDYKDREQE